MPDSSASMEHPRKKSTHPVSGTFKLTRSEKEISEAKNGSDGSYSERYSFSWAGRSKCIRARDTPPTGSLIPLASQSINFEGTKNWFIVGDNLEVLKNLSESHRGMIKMIYIDPPFNAGSAAIYNDNYRDRVKDCSANPPEHTKSFTSNLETSGRHHSRWLSMIYPRISIARELLCKDGLMFVSIDDTEFHNLRLVMNEIFGEQNVEVMIWKKVESNEGKLKLIRRFRIDHEYILVGYKNKEKCSFRKVMEVPRFKTPPKLNPDSDPRGPWVSGNMSMTESISKKGGRNYYTIESPSRKKWTRQWKFPRAEYEKLKQDNKIYWGPEGNNVPRLKVFPDEPKRVYVSSIIAEKGTAKSATVEVAKLLGYNVFSNPKPVELIQYLIDAARTEHGIVMDFFAGSGTTAHAVLAQNAVDGGDRSFILVQSAEPPILGRNASPEIKGVRSISDITRKRIIATFKLFGNDGKPELDLGMKVFQLST